MAKHLKRNRGLGREDCQHEVIDEFWCMVAGCALQTDSDLCHWMLKQKVNIVQGQQDSPLRTRCHNIHQMSITW